MDVVFDGDAMPSPASARLSVLDRRARPLRDLRVSVTDRCNFRCPYCMPRDAYRTHRFLPKREILNFEEIARVVSVFAELGVRKVRLTGGEPLLRTDLPVLVRMLRERGDFELALTTNGSRLEALARPLRDAGLSRVTVSLDSLDPEVFRAMSDTDVPLEVVLRGIDTARQVGFSVVKVNTVIQRGKNEDGVLDLVRRFRGTGVVVRFIEFMDVGSTNGWDPATVVPAREIVARIDDVFPLEPVSDGAPGRIAQRYRYRDGSGEIGVIASVTEPFCGGCTRARLSADGHLYTCLFASIGRDLRPVLRDGSSDDVIRDVLAAAWRDRDDRYSEVRFASTAPKKIEMSYIGG